MVTLTRRNNDNDHENNAYTDELPTDTLIFSNK